MEEIDVESESACVVYEAKTGRVVHLHRVITLRGGRAPRREEIEARALELAGKRTAAALKALHVEPASVDGVGDLKVNLKALKLIATPARVPPRRPARPRRAAPAHGRPKPARGKKKR